MLRRSVWLIICLRLRQADQVFATSPQVKTEHEILSATCQPSDFFCSHEQMSVLQHTVHGFYRRTSNTLNCAFTSRLIQQRRHLVQESAEPTPDASSSSSQADLVITQQIHEPPPSQPLSVQGTIINKKAFSVGTDQTSQHASNAAPKNSNIKVPPVAGRPRRGKPTTRFVETKAILLDLPSRLPRRKTTKETRRANALLALTKKFTHKSRLGDAGVLKAKKKRTFPSSVGDLEGGSTGDAKSTTNFDNSDTLLAGEDWNVAGTYYYVAVFNP